MKGWTSAGRQRWPRHAAPPGCRARAGLLLAWALVAAGLPARATAGEPDEGVRAHFEAQTLIAQGRYKEASERLEEGQRWPSDRLALWTLAACHEKAGRAARAWEVYRQLAEAPRVSPEDERLARARAQALEPRLARLTLKAPRAPLGELLVTLDGVPLTHRWGEELRVDAGEHRIEVRAVGFRPWQGVVLATAGRGPMTVEVPELVAATGEPAAAAAPLASATPLRTDALDSDDAPEAPTYTAAWVAGGIGLAGLTLGAVAGWLASSKSHEARRLCSRQAEGCPQTPKDDRAALKRYARGAHQVSDVALGVGAIGLVAGGALFFITRGQETESPDFVNVAPSVGMDRIGVSLSGAF